MIIQINQINVNYNLLLEELIYEITSLISLYHNVLVLLKLINDCYLYYEGMNTDS